LTDGINPGVILTGLEESLQSHADILAFEKHTWRESPRRSPPFGVNAGSSSYLLNCLDVDRVARDVHGSRYFYFLPDKLAGLFRIVQHIGELARAIVQNEVVAVLDNGPRKYFRLLLGFLLRWRRLYRCGSYGMASRENQQSAG
jgi:hypothetical protein